MLADALGEAAIHDECHTYDAVMESAFDLDALTLLEEEVDAVGGHGRAWGSHGGAEAWS